MPVAKLKAPIYVDKLFVMQSRDPVAWKVGARNGHQWCHMWCEDLERLHWMAERIGMKRAWFQDHGESRLTGIRFPHYDLVPGKRRLAIAYGAVERDLGSWLKEKRAGAIQQEKTEGTENRNSNENTTAKKQIGFDFFEAHSGAARKHFDGG